MGFTISCSSKFNGYVPELKYGNIDWYLQLGLRKGLATIWMGGSPSREIIRATLPWKITVDVSTCIGSRKPAVLRDKKIYVNDKNNVVTEVFQEIDFLVRMETTDLPVTFHVFNIRTEGLRKFGMKKFDNRDSKEDLTLTVDDHIFYCHSQILSLNSSVFEAMIEQNVCSTEISLGAMISAEELRELLHHIYFPSEIVDENNFRLLLHWGKKFEVNQVLEHCQQVMESQLWGLKSTADTKLEIFLLFWSYCVEPIKISSTETVFPSKPPGLMSKISKSEIYQSMGETQKLQMWKFLFERLYL